jgi:hypothetical protein
MCPELHVIEKKTEFTKPATKELIKTSTKIRSTILNNLWADIMSHDLEVKMPAVEMSGSDEFFISLTDLGQKYRDSWTELGVPKTKFFLEGNKKTLYGEELEQFVEDNYKDETMEEIHLVDGGAIMQDLREAIFDNTGIVCSGKKIIFFL